LPKPKLGQAQQAPTGMMLPTGRRTGYEFLLKYCQIYTYAARLIANRANAPKWTAGDKYEKAFMELYK
jgi:hypothetical protein